MALSKEYHFSLYMWQGYIANDSEVVGTIGDVKTVDGTSHCWIKVLNTVAERMDVALMVHVSWTNGGVEHMNQDMPRPFRALLNERGHPERK